MVKQGKEPTDTDTKEKLHTLPWSASTANRGSASQVHTNKSSQITHFTAAQNYVKHLLTLCLGSRVVCRVREKGGLEAKPSRRRSSWPFLGRRPSLPTSHPTRLQTQFPPCKIDPGVNLELLRITKRISFRRVDFWPLPFISHREWGVLHSMTQSVLHNIRLKPRVVISNTSKSRPNVKQVAGAAFPVLWLPTESISSCTLFFIERSNTTGYFKIQWDRW